MSFVEITKPSVGEPTKKSLADLIIDNLSDLNSRTSPSSRVNMISNGSFELDTNSDNTPDSWVATDYTGGSHTISTTNNVNGVNSLAFTSTSTANGGGYAQTEDFLDVTGGESYYWFLFRGASVANVSSKAEITWYDEAQSSISTSTLYSETSAPTSMTSTEGTVSAPATARYAKFITTGGVPGSGSATGTVYFDDVRLNIAINQSFILNSAVGQGELKTTTASGTASLSNGIGTATYTLTGGTYSWWTASADEPAPQFVSFGNGNTAAGVIGLLRGSTSNIATFYLDERYVQACPPYTHGPLFVYAAMNPDGTIADITVAVDPIWAYHGPTDITPQRRAGGKEYRKARFIDGIAYHKAIKDPNIVRRLLLEQTEIVEQEVEITLAYKDSDKDIVPHPFVGNDLTGKTIVMLEPGTKMSSVLADMCNQGHAREARDIFLNDYIRISNIEIAVPGIPAVAKCVRAAWRNT